MSKDTYSSLFVGRNWYVAAASLLSLPGNNNGDSEKQDIVSNIEFEAAVPSINKNFFHQIVVHFLNKLKLND